MSLTIPDDNVEKYPVPKEDGVVLHYRIPTNPEIYALYYRNSVNGRLNPAIFGEAKKGATKKGKKAKSGDSLDDMDFSKQDGNKVIIFGYEAAVLFVVGWSGVVVKRDGQEIAVPFSKEALERLPSNVVTGFAMDVVFPFIGRVATTGSGSEQEDDAVPN